MNASFWRLVSAIGVFIGLGICITAGVFQELQAVGIVVLAILGTVGIVFIALSSIVFIWSLIDHQITLLKFRWMDAKRKKNSI